jgi:hypothetical protein
VRVSARIRVAIVFLVAQSRRRKKKEKEKAEFIHMFRVVLSYRYIQVRSISRIKKEFPSHVIIRSYRRDDRRTSIHI